MTFCICDLSASAQAVTFQVPVMVLAEEGCAKMWVKEPVSPEDMAKKEQWKADRRWRT